MLTVTTCFPPAVGLCLAFVLIPSHHWVQAPGPPTQLCQRFPEEGAQIWLGRLNYPSAPQAGQMRAAAAGSRGTKNAHNSGISDLSV